jgi:hypothetical protein
MLIGLGTCCLSYSDFFLPWIRYLDLLVRPQLLDGPADAWNNCITTLEHSALHLHKGQSQINDSYFLLHAAYKLEMLKFHRTSLQDSWRYGCFKPSEPSLSVSMLITRGIVSQSQCLLTLTYFVMQPKVSYVWHRKFYPHRLFVRIPFPLYSLTGTYGGLSHLISGTELGLASGSHRFPQFCAVEESSNHSFVVGIRVIKATTNPQLW